MAVTLRQIRQAKKQFTEDYINKSPFDKYVYSCSISTIDEALQRTGKKINLNSDEALEDLCLRVSIKKNKPKDLGLPEPFYQGVRIFYELFIPLRNVFEDLGIDVEE